MEKENSGWKSSEAAENYKKIINFIVPGRAEILEKIAGIATISGKDHLKILDIGCGHGDVTDAVMQLAKGASFTLDDYSEAMVDSSRERFKEYPDIEVIQQDLNDGLPDLVKGRQFDAVVSCFALHHVEYECRIGLYSDVRDVLAPGAFFINGDMFKGDSPEMDSWEFDNWVAWMTAKLKENLDWDMTFEEVKRRQLESFEKMGDKPGTVWDMFSDMKAAGFRHVDCMFKIQNLAVLAAQK